MKKLKRISLVGILLIPFLSLLGGYCFLQAELPYYAQKSWAAAISKWKYKIPDGYSEIVDELISKNGFEKNFSNSNKNWQTNNTAIIKTINELPENFGKIKNILEVGPILANFYLWSSICLCWNILSPIFMFYLILVGSFMIFWLNFKTLRIANLILINLTLAFIFMITWLPEIQQAVALHNSRCWSVLCIIPALHYFFSFNNPKIQTVVAANLQTAIPVFVMLQRPSAIWFLIFLWAFFVFNLLRAHLLRKITKKGWLLLFIPVLSATLAYLYTKDLVEKTTNSKYTIWHSIAVGLLMSENIRKNANVNLQKDFKIIQSPSDADAYLLTAKYANLKERKKIYEITENNIKITPDFDWHKYQTDSKEAVLNLFINITFFDFIKNLLQKSTQFILCFFVPDWGPSLKLLPSLAIVCTFYALSKIQISSLCYKPLFLIGAFSLIPMLLAYPQPHGLIDSYILLTTLIFTKAGELIFKKMKNKKLKFDIKK